MDRWLPSGLLPERLRRSLFVPGHPKHTFQGGSVAPGLSACLGQVVDGILPTLQDRCVLCL